VLLHLKESLHLCHLLLKELLLASLELMLMLHCLHLSGIFWRFNKMTGVGLNGCDL
jgi:hypothetical protein